MNALRRRVASGALALTLLQCALLFMAPVSACCSGALRIQADAQVECCPPGSHPPGQCPLHRGSKSADQQRGRTCRMLCDAPHGPQFVLGMAGVIGGPPSTFTDIDVSPLRDRVTPATTARPSLPDAPPPRTL